MVPLGSAGKEGDLLTPPPPPRILLVQGFPDAVVSEAKVDEGWEAATDEEGAS